MDIHIDIKKAVEAVSKPLMMQGLTLTNNQIADKLGIPKDRFQAYLEGKEPVPPDLSVKILEAYGHQVKTVSHTAKKQLDLPRKRKITAEKDNMTSRKNKTSKLPASSLPLYIMELLGVSSAALIMSHSLVAVLLFATAISAKGQGHYHSDSNIPPSGSS